MLSFTLAGAAGAADVAQSEPEHARARLISEHAFAIPGETLALGVTFDIDQGWHLYWDGCNDSGFPIDIKLTLPDGWIAGGVQWPAPDRRYAAPGGLVLDHIYERRVTLIVPVQVPESAESSAGVNIAADVEWLVCKDACIPGFAELSVAIPVKPLHTDPVLTREAPLFEEARKAHPKPMRGGARAPYRITWEGSTMVIRGDSADVLSFYPQRECGRLVDRFTDPVSKEGVLRLRFKDGPETVRVQGVLDVRDRQGVRKGVYTLTWPATPMETRAGDTIHSMTKE